MRDFKPAPSPSTDSGVPVLQLSTTHDRSDDGPATSYYLLTNLNELYRIDNLGVQSATPDVTVTDVTPNWLSPLSVEPSGEEGKPDRAAADNAIVTVAFANDCFVPWKALITYDATIRSTTEQEMA